MLTGGLGGIGLRLIFRIGASSVSQPSCSSLRLCMCPQDPNHVLSLCTLNALALALTMTHSFYYLCICKYLFFSLLELSSYADYVY